MKQIARVTLLLLFLSALVPCLVFAETADQWNAKGLEYLAVGNLDKALECYNKAIKADPALSLRLYQQGLGLQPHGRIRQGDPGRHQGHRPETLLLPGRSL